MLVTFLLILAFVTNLGGVPSPFAFVVEEKGPEVNHMVGVFILLD